MSRGVGSCVAPAQPIVNAPHDKNKPTESPAVQGGARALKIHCQIGEVAIQPLVVLVASREQHTQFLDVDFVQRHTDAEALWQLAVDVDRRVRIGELLDWTFAGIEIQRN